MQGAVNYFDIVQLIYCSRAAHSGVSVLLERDIQDILAFGQIRNFLHEITGALMTDGKMFAHALEGPIGAVEDLHSRITRDKRHSGVVTLQHVPVHVRLFNHWPIAFIRVKSLHHLSTLNAQSTPAELRKASVSILKAFRPALLR